jgi:hypothetical protein
MTSLGIPPAVFAHARRVASDIGRRCAELGGARMRIDADQILTGRAALLELPPPGRVSSGGATRLLAANDGWFALTLSRPDDVDAVPALLELPHVAPDPWTALAAAATRRTAADMVARARLLGLPAAAPGEAVAAPPTILAHNQTAASTLTNAVVVDLSSMWAGPLCGRLLAEAGATVVKVETPHRPDGTRAGSRDFFDWMNGGKLCYAADLDSDEMTELLAAADVVIEGSRPAALARRGVGAEQVRAWPGRVWVRISGYGSDYPDRVAFGDDAAVAGGLVRYRDGEPLFCGDAIADPLTGLHATLAVLDALASGGGSIIDLSMAAVAAGYAALTPHGADDDRRPVRPRPAQKAHEIGADNPMVHRLIAARRVAC